MTVETPAEGLGANLPGPRPPIYPGVTFDEVRDASGVLRPGWAELTRLAQAGRSLPTDWASLQAEVDRRLADDAVTFRPWSARTVADPESDDPESAAPVDEVSEPQPWRLDPVPAVLHAREWSDLEMGLVQRAELLSALLADLYGPRRLLAEGVLPPEVVMAHPGYLRPLIGSGVATGLFMAGIGLGRIGDGSWRARSVQTQAPVGAGYAMENRRVLSRVHAGLYRAGNLVRLTPFYQAMRAALVEAGPREVEDPHVVVLTPGTHAPTAFDQAFLASRLGFPLVEGRDLVVQDGRVWLRSVDRLEPVDVIFRHVISRATDPLELQAGSRLGVAGLTEVVRRGAVSVVNALGAGVLENLALAAFDDRICRALLDEPLRLRSFPTWWCGDPSARSRVLTGLADLRVVHLPTGQTWEGPLLSADQRASLADRIDTHPYAYAGQQPMPLSTTPTVVRGELAAERFHLTTYLIRHGATYATLPGGLGEVHEDPQPTSPGPGGLTGRPTKDLWIVQGSDVPAAGESPRDVVDELIPGNLAMVPRVLDDLYWMGRYAERAEDTVRLIAATHHVLVETNMVAGPGSAADVLLRALFAQTGTPRPAAGSSGLRQLRRLLIDWSQRGTVARSLARLSYAADGVRDQLSHDVWVVLAGAERALAALRRADPEDSSRLADTAAAGLVSLLALNGITAENMVRDSGWQLLDAGRGVERAIQVVGLLRSGLTMPGRGDGDWDSPTNQMVLTAVLTAAESIVTHRRRHGGRTELATVLDLLVADVANPRSVAFQVARIRAALARLPHAPANGRPQRLLDELADLTSVAAVARVSDVETTVEPPVLASIARADDHLAEVRHRLHRLSDAISEAYLRPEPEPQPMWVVADLPIGPAGGGM